MAGFDPGATSPADMEGWEGRKASLEDYLYGRELVPQRKGAAAKAAAAIFLHLASSKLKMQILERLKEELP